MFSVLAARFAPFSIAHPLALALLVLVLQTSLVSAKQAKYGTYNFTFFVEEDCSGETNGESMVGEVGEPYCMNFTQGVMSARAEFTNLSTADGKMLDGVGLLYRTQQDQPCGNRTEVPTVPYYGTRDENHCWVPTNGACHKKMADGFHYFYSGDVDTGTSCHDG